MTVVRSSRLYPARSSMSKSNEQLTRRSGVLLRRDVSVLQPEAWGPSWLTHRSQSKEKWR